MSNGKVHDLGGASVGFFILAAPLLVSTIIDPVEHDSLIFSMGWQKYTAMAGGACIFGTLMLSPDLDVFPWRSVCQQRWDNIGFGPLNLGWIWEPYRRYIGHRDGLSHSILLGSTIRVLYLLAWASTLLVFQPIRDINWMHIALTNQGLLVAAFVGVEISALVHYLLDGLIHKWIKKMFAKMIPYDKSGKKSGKKNKRKPITPRRSQRRRRSRT